MPKTTIGKSLFLDGELTGKDGLIIKGKLFIKNVTLKLI